MNFSLYRSCQQRNKELILDLTLADNNEEKFFSLLLDATLFIDLAEQYNGKPCDVIPCSRFSYLFTIQLSISFDSLEQMISFKEILKYF